MVFDTYIEVLSSFVPLIISFSLPPITIRSVLCRTGSRTILLIMLGSVEALQKKTVYPFRVRVRVGELCSLLLLCCHPHLFQVCYSHYVLNTALNISSSRTVPSSYDTQYAQPRSSSRVMLNSYYAQWPDGSNCMDPSFTISSNLMETLILVALSSNESMFVPNYEPQDRYSVQSSYPTYIPPRAPSLFQDLTDSRRLPSLSTTSAAGGDRWQQNLSPNSAPAGIRSPTLSYPTYASYPSGGGAYTYLPTNNLVMNTGVLDLNEPQVRPSSPGLYRTPVVDSSSTPPAPPISPTTTTERPTIKVKRRRANEDQRKKLLETWERTSFPTTEERNKLSILTGLKPRQVQVW